MLGHASPEMLCSVYARFMRACARRKSIKPGARVGKHGAEGGTRTPTGCPTRPSNVRVCQFRHFGARRERSITRLSARDNSPDALAEPRVERVSDPLAEEVVGQDRDEDREPRVDGEPPADLDR